MKRLSCNYNVIEVIETNACVYTKLSPVCTFFFLRLLRIYNVLSTNDISEAVEDVKNK